MAMGKYFHLKTLALKFFDKLEGLIRNVSMLGVSKMEMALEMDKVVVFKLDEMVGVEGEAENR